MPHRQTRQMLLLGHLVAGSLAGATQPQTPPPIELRSTAYLMRLATHLLDSPATPAQMWLQNTGHSAPCGVEVRWGDGHTEKFRLETGKPVPVTHTYAQPGAYAVVVEGALVSRGLRTVFPCTGTSLSIAVQVAAEAVTAAPPTAANPHDAPNAKWPAHPDPQQSTLVQHNGLRVALLMGNARYSGGMPALRNPPKDVDTLAASLKQLGFVVQVLKDGDLKAMGSAIRQFGTQAQDAQVAFFYYSGHGMQARNENFLIPLGAGIAREADLEIEAVALRSLMSQIDEARPQTAVVVLDACRDNPLAARTKSASKGLGRVQSQHSNTLVVFAAQAGQTASDNGMFAQALASHITQPNTGLRSIFDNVNKAVRQASGNTQSIERNDQLSQDVVLLLNNPESAVSPPRTVAGRLSLEDLQQETDRRQAWEQWQAEMKADFDKAAAFKSSPDLQAQAWTRFLDIWAQDNPLSKEDNILRAQAQSRLQRLRAGL